MATCTKGRVVVYGGKGALGSIIVNKFKAENYWVASIDLSPNEAANANVLVKSTGEWVEQEARVRKEVDALLIGEKVDAIVCVAGGWAGGNASSPDVVKNADLMWKQSVWSSLIAATIASSYLRTGGLLQLTGANPSLGATPGMIGYGMAKAAVHQLTKSLAGKKSGLPADSCVVAILPVTLDTPLNRHFMPEADFTSWTPLSFVADTILQWTIEKKSRPVSGSLMQLNTKEGKTTLNNRWRERNVWTM